MMKHSVKEGNRATPKAQKYGRHRTREPGYRRSFEPSVASVVRDKTGFLFFVAKVGI